jgi:hypothetical protein
MQNKEHHLKKGHIQIPKNGQKISWDASSKQHHMTKQRG